MKDVTIVAVILCVGLLTGGYAVWQNKEYSSESVWIECGLLHTTPTYTASYCMAVLDHFPSFDSVIVDPFPLDNRVYEVASALDNYTSRTISKFLVVGVGGSVNFTLVDEFKSRGYIMLIDDSGTEARANLETLKSKGCKTALVVFDTSVSSLFVSGLVDYACFAFYPYFETSTNYDSQKQVMDNIAQLCRQYYVSFIVAAQFFGKAANNWRFPSLSELQQLLTDAKSVANGICFFEPLSGQSDRGEYFDGFLHHMEVWSLILS